MANIREIKTRIDSVKSTKQITNAMKMVAAARLRKAQERIVKARPYANMLNDMLASIKYKNSFSGHPLLDEVKDGKEALLVVTSDRGLCGSFNSNIIRRADEYIEKNPNADIICLGKKGFDHIKKRTDNVIEKYLYLFNEMDFTHSKEIGTFLLNLFLEKGYAKVNVLYNEFKSAIQQNVIVKQLFPIVPLKTDEISTLDYLYEPDEKTIIEELAHKFGDVEIWRIMLESSAAEQGARMTAMDSATDNAAELIEALTLKYNRVRQAGITTEIIEISSGAEALQ